jgi:hypothetical protein
VANIASRSARTGVRGEPMDAKPLQARFSANTSSYRHHRGDTKGMIMSESLDTSGLRELTGKSRQSLHKAEKAGRLYRDPVTGRFDPTVEVNRLFIERSRTEQNKDDTGELEAAEESPTNIKQLYADKLQAEIQRINEQRRHYELDNAERARSLVPIQFVTEQAGQFASGIRAHLLPMGTRLAPRITATLQSGGTEQDVQQLIEDEVEDVINRALSLGEKSLDELVAQTPDDEDEQGGNDE